MIGEYALELERLQELNSFHVGDESLVTFLPGLGWVGIRGKTV